MTSQRFGHYGEAAATWRAWPWPNFSAFELACKAPSTMPGDRGELVIVPTFMARLQALRLIYGKPMTITSGYRTPDHNVKVSGSGRTGPHTTGRAVDVAAAGNDQHEITRLALSVGFTGIGIARTFIHLDDLLPADGFGPRPNIWTYQ